MRKHHLALAAVLLAVVPTIGCDNEYDPDAPAIEQLVAWCGRTPAWPS